MLIKRVSNYCQTFMQAYFLHIFDALKFNLNQYDKKNNI